MKPPTSRGTLLRAVYFHCWLGALCVCHFKELRSTLLSVSCYGVNLTWTTDHVEIRRPTLLI